ncbi:MAG: ABC transporter permease [Chloroflexota bacterium]|nr:ABC transporter permease [Chloroflexota bacterium]MDQ6907223.1 ABC transporter permease [Chloroflexota bacterium]
MRQYIMRRLLLLPVTALGVSILVFMVLHLVPGNPAQVIAGADAPPATVKQIEHELGLDKPLPEQYWNYLRRVLQGDLGRSLRSKRPVTSDIRDALPNTLVLAALAALLTPLVAIPLGMIAATRQGTPADTAVTFFSTIGITVPTFAVGLLLIFFFGIRLGWMPISGIGGSLRSLDGLKHAILPAITLSLGSIAVVTRLSRSALLEVLNQDYIRTARAKGLRERSVILRHGFKNALLPVITVYGLQIGALLSGAVVTETVFAWPGIGRLALSAIQGRDFPVVQGCLLVVATIFVLVNLAVDLLYALVDPRIHYT